MPAVKLVVAPGGDRLSETITFLFTDVVGSTRLWETAPDEMGPAVARHDDLVTAVVDRHCGRVVKPRGEGDSQFCVFDRAADAVHAAVGVIEALAAESWTTPSPVRVRAAIHTGQAAWRDGDLYGRAVNRTARLRSLAHPSQILVSSVAAEQARPELSPPAELVELGWYRLKDLDDPERVFEVLHPRLPASYPPLTSPARADNLPAPTTSLVGRADDLAELRQHLAGSRLVTVVGPGGTGKTRLTIEAAYAARGRYRDGVWLAELAPVHDSGAVAATVAGAVGIELTPASDPFATIADTLADRELLLVVDNAEHVIDSVAELVDRSLVASPNLHVLVSSREPLAVAGEAVMTLAPLAVPPATGTVDAATAGRYASVALLVERASTADRAFRLAADDVGAVCEICRRLDGLPLAIELAAARFRTTTPTELAAGLASRLDLIGRRRTGTGPAHHQTLTATIAWSWDLLDEPERRLLAWLSGFAGTFSADAAERVCGPGAAVTLMLLVDRSFVEVADRRARLTRYRLLETIKLFAAERLAATGDLERRDRSLVAWAVELAEHAERHFHGPGQVAAFDLLDVEHPNLLAALDRADTTSFGRLCRALWWFWARRGHTRESATRLARARQLALPPDLEAVVLLAAGHLANLVDVTGEDLLEQAARSADRIGDHATAAFARSVLTNLYVFTGRARQAGHLSEQSVADARRSETPWVLATALRNLGHHRWWVGDYAGAAAALGESLAACQATGDPRSPLVLEILALVHMARGDTPEALNLLEEAVAALDAGGDARMAVQVRADLGEAHRRSGHLEVAAEILLEGLDTAQRIDGEFESAACHAHLAVVRYVQNRPAEARTELAAAAASSDGSPHSLATCLHLGATIAADLGDHRKATALLGALDHLQTATGPEPQPADHTDQLRLAQTCKDQLGEAGFATAWDGGHHLTAAETQTLLRNL